MKRILEIIAVSSALALPGVTVAPAQDKPEPGTRAVVEKSLHQAEDEVRMQLDKANQQLGNVRERVASVVRRKEGSAQPLIIRTSETDPQVQAHLEEDLAVMSRILDKAVMQSAEESGPRHAMGINILFGPGPNSMRNMYLEGYGALFMLNVGFPLVPPPAKSKVKKEEPPGDSTWEEAKREVYGQHVERRIALPPAPEYSEEQVNSLKDGLFEALKNATNIRELKPDDSITVCAFGGGPAAVRFKALVKRGTKGQPDEDVTVDRSEPASARGTMMTIRVKKSDVDSFAQGKLSIEDFRKKASLTTATYASDDGRWNGGFSFGFGSGGGGGGGFGERP